LRGMRHAPPSFVEKIDATPPACHTRPSVSRFKYLVIRGSGMTDRPRGAVFFEVGQPRFTAFRESAFVLRHSCAPSGAPERRDPARQQRLFRVIVPSISVPKTAAYERPPHPRSCRRYQFRAGRTAHYLVPCFRYTPFHALQINHQHPTECRIVGSICPGPLRRNSSWRPSLFLIVLCWSANRPALSQHMEPATKNTCETICCLAPAPSKRFSRGAHARAGPFG